MTVTQIIEMVKVALEVTVIQIIEMVKAALEATVTQITETVNKDVMTDVILRQRMILSLKQSQIQERLTTEKIIRRMTDEKTMSQKKILSL